MEISLENLYQYALRFLKQDDPDLNILLDQCEKLLKLPYPTVILAISKIIFEFP